MSFYTTELRDAYLESKSTYQTRSNATGVADYRTSSSHSYKSRATSGSLSSTAYGGKAGATLTLSAAVSFSAPESGF
ncbi:hypothetical protein SMSK321_0392 [Streptococcus mitis SK321]|nr:hypothetical protein SMSK321_0392 [Streptococcus mitis SK321]